MSESSLPSFRPTRFRLLLRTLRSRRSKEALGRLYARGRRNAGIIGPVQESTLESQAALAVREYLDAYAANLERAARLEEKAERLEKAGTPSESARNRAEQARGEVVASLAALRASFVEAAGGQDGAYAFDRMVKLSYPAFTPHRPSDGRPR